MEKDFESYNYLVKYNDTQENDNTGQEILIVHENSHFVNVNKPNRHYVQEVEDSKPLETIAGSLHDSQQPVYFQLNNSSELVPISVNPIQLAETPNVFGNNYLLHNSTESLAAPENYIVKNSAPFISNLKQECQNMDVESNKITTEITITDEQYEILKQKGWILLEIKNDIFLLDSSGLNNITNNQEFITKLKHEMDITDIESQPTRFSMKQEIDSKDEIVDVNIVSKHEDFTQVEPIEIITRTKTVQGENIKSEMKQGPINAQLSLSYKLLKEHDVIKDKPPKDVVIPKYKCNDIQLKCQYLLKDIPKRIVLGKTINGKKLVARVVKAKRSVKNTSNMHSEMGSQKKRDS